MKSKLPILPSRAHTSPHTPRVGENAPRAGVCVGDLRVISGRQLAIEGERRERQLAREVRIVRSSIAFAVSGRQYEVPLARCRTHADLLSWILHLSEKSWFTPQHQRRFVLLVCERNGLTINWNA